MKVEEEEMGKGGGTMSMSRAAESSWERRLALQWCRTTHTRPGLGLKLHLGTAWIARTPQTNTHFRSTRPSVRTFLNIRAD